MINEPDTFVFLSWSFEISSIELKSTKNRSSIGYILAVQRHRLSKSEQLPPNYYISNNSSRTISHRVAGSTSATPPFSGKMEGKYRVWSSCTCLPEGGEVSVGRTTARNVTWPSGSFGFSGCYYRRHFSRLRKRVFHMGEPWKIFDRCNWIEIVPFWLGGNTTWITICTFLNFMKFVMFRGITCHANGFYLLNNLLYK